MLRRQSDLLLGILLSLVLLGLTIFGFFPPIIRIILAVPFVLIVPGNALISAIFPEASITRLEKVLFGVGASLGVVIISGLVLNLTPGGLKQSSWVYMLSGITLVSSVIAMSRRYHAPVIPSTPGHFFIPAHQVVLAVIATAVIGLSIALAFTPQPSYSIQGYTSLWISPGSGSKPSDVVIGIHSQELSATQYTLRVTFNGQPVEKDLSINLAPGENWQQTISLPAGKGLAEALLYQADNPSMVYRHVSSEIKP